MIKGLSIKARGGAMGVSILVSMLVTFMALFLLLRARMYTLESHITDIREKLMYNVNSGLEVLLAGGEFIQPDSHRHLDLFDKGGDSVELIRKSWGGYEVLSSRAYSGNYSVEKTAIVGQVLLNEDSRCSLYLCDLDKPLSLCGNTRLDGRLYLPRFGVKRAYIEGQNYTGDKLLYGQRLPSGRDLPAFNRSLALSLKKSLAKSWNDTDSVVFAEGLPQVDSIIHPFSNRTLIIQSPGTLKPGFSLLKGNIILSASRIIIPRSAKLEDVICFAEEIIVEDDVEGHFQGFASKSISIGKHCKLNYPSVFGILTQGPSQTPDIPTLQVGEATELCGNLFCYDEKPLYNREHRMALDRSVKIEGEIYINGLLDLKADVHGSVYCHRFMIKTPSSVYENHLLNVEINANKLSKYFTGINLLENQSRKEIVRWM